MSSGKRRYRIRPIVINGRLINEVLIDQHYEKKHSSYMTDTLAIALVKELDGHLQAPDVVRGAFEYFATPMQHEGKQYRLIWLLEHGTIYVGIINAYRDRRKK